MIQLRVWANDRPMGWFGHAEAAYFFEYDQTWLTDPGSFVLAPQFPLGTERFTGQAVRNFFFNLLPEGAAYEEILNDLKDPGASAFDVIGELGDESLGVISILPEGRTPLINQQISPLTREDLSQRIRDRGANKPFLRSNQQASMSLPGAQDKLGLRFDSKSKSYWDTVSTTPSTHIAKPDTRLVAFAPSAINEYLVMRLAKELKLDVPDVDFDQVPESLFIVRRYDRTEVGGKTVCQHQADLCQLLSVGADWKYERQGGLVSHKLIVAKLRELRLPGSDMLMFQRWVMFNFLVGNSDAHAKNISVLISSGGYRLAPFYDLLCVQAYGDNRLALFIGDDEQFAAVGAHSWEAFCDDCGFGYKATMKLFRDMAKKVVSALKKVIQRDLATYEFSPKEVDLLGKIGRVIEANSKAAISMTDTGSRKP